MYRFWDIQRWITACWARVIRGKGRCLRPQSEFLGPSLLRIYCIRTLPCTTPGGLAIATESFQFWRHSRPINLIVFVVRLQPVDWRSDADEGRVATDSVNGGPRGGGDEAPSLGVDSQLGADPLATIDLVVGDHWRCVGHQRLVRYRDVLLERRHLVALDLFQRRFSYIAHPLTYGANINPLSRFCIQQQTPDFRENER